MSKLKKLMAGAILGTSAFACAVATNVKAAEVDMNVTYDVSSDQKTATWDFMAATTNVNVAAGNSIKGIDVVTGTVKGKGTYISMTLTSLNFPVPVGSAGNISVYADSNNSERGYTVENNTTQYVSTKDTRDWSYPCTVPFLTTDTDDGYVTLTTYGGEMKPYGFKVTLTTDNQFEAVAKNYTVTYYNGSKVLDSEKVTSGNKISKATQKLLGYTFVGLYNDSEFNSPFDSANDTITSDKSIYVKFEKNASYNANKNELSASTITAIFDLYGKDNTFASDLEVTDTMFTVLNACKVTTNSDDKCIATAGGVTAANKGVKFTAPSNGIITVSMTSGGTSARNAKMIDSTGTEITAASGNAIWTATEAAAYEVRTLTYNVENGKTYIMGGSNSMRILSMSFADESSTVAPKVMQQTSVDNTAVRFYSVVTADASKVESIVFTLSNGTDEGIIDVVTVYETLNAGYAANAITTTEGQFIAAAYVTNIPAGINVTFVNMVITFNDGTPAITVTAIA